ncbi:MAG: hypothetical protein KIT45_04480 [Fimbriimonadia bacterium]|nr:hypothetical protein [Fimbriimonadia bacterium]
METNSSARGDQWGSGYSVEGVSLRTRYQMFLRPMTIQEMVDDAIALYREDFRTLFTLSLMVWLPFLGISLLTLVSVIALNASSDGSTMFNPADIIVLLVALLTMPGLIFAPGIQSGLLTLATHMRLMGEKPTPREVWARFKPRFWVLVANQGLASIGLSIFWGAIGILVFLLYLAWAVIVAAVLPGSEVIGLVMLFLGFLLLTILMLVLAALGTVWVILLPQVIVLEKVDALQAFSRAFQLVRPQFKRAVGCVIFVWGVQSVLFISSLILVGIALVILVGIISIYYDLEVMLLQWQATLNQLSNLLNYIPYILVMPAICISSLMLYYDFRYRNEGLDIQLLGQEER